MKIGKMKKLLLLLFISVSLSAQIGKSSSDSKEKLLGEEVSLFHSTGINGIVSISINDKLKDDRGTPYHIMTFQNQEYHQLKDFQVAGFYAAKDDIEYLFNEMIKVFKTKKTINIPIGKSVMKVSSFSSIGKEILIQISGEAEGYFSLTPAGVYYLLGKKNKWNRKEWKKYLKS